MKFECRFEDNSKYFHFIIVKVVMLLQSISVVIAFIGTLRYERQDMYDLERPLNPVGPMPKTMNYGLME